MIPTPGDLERAHKRSIYHRAEILGSGLCGCFGCLETFEPRVIEEWTDKGDTALCPFCGIDSVIGDASGYPITEEFLTAMEARWFGFKSR
jgi:hypothetical protein